MATPATSLAVGAFTVVMLAGLSVARPAEHRGLQLSRLGEIALFLGFGLVGVIVAWALFNPVRHRVQRAVDRRFNRDRYDADRMVAAFAARLQDAVDLGTVRADLLGVVQGALSRHTCRCGSRQSTDALA